MARDQETLEKAIPHIHYECSMLFRGCVLLFKYHDTVDQPDKGAYSMFVEAFVTHVRNLIDFLYETSGGEYVRAGDFFEQRSHWPPRAQLPSEIKDWKDRANVQVNHIGVDRTNTPAGGWDWPFGRMTEVLSARLVELKEAAATHDRKLLLWLIANCEATATEIMSELLRFLPEENASIVAGTTAMPRAQQRVANIGDPRMSAKTGP